MTEPIPHADLDFHRVRLCRKCAAAIVTAMAETGITFEQMDFRVSLTPGTSKGWLLNLVEGKSKTIDNVSDMLLSMGYELDWRVAKAIPIPFSEPEKAQAVAA